MVEHYSVYDDVIETRLLSLHDLKFAAVVLRSALPSRLAVIVVVIGHEHTDRDTWGIVVVVG
jgi:hypothetical protein